MTAHSSPRQALLRDATAADAPRIAPLLGELGYPTSLEATRAQLDRLLASDADCVIVAEDGGELLAVATLHRMLGIHDAEPIALISSIVVTERARGGGVGRDLIAALEEVARRWGCRRIVVMTANHRAPAHAFYERRGFTFTGRRYAKALG